MKGTATVKKIVYGGWGLAHHEGATLFLQCAAAGDKVEFAISKKKKNCLFGRVERVLEPSPQRIEPECPVFGECGGCHLLHLSYEDELEVKKIALLENLERIGKVKIPITGVIKSPQRFGYRNHALFKVDGQGSAGFTMRESRTIVPFPPEGCLLLPPEMRRAISRLPKAAMPRNEEVRTRMDSFGAVHFWGLDGISGPPDSLMKAGGFSFPVHPSAFFQVNRYLNDPLMELASSLPTRARRRLLDCYCGVGFFTLALSKIVGEALGIERERASFRNAQAAARLNGISNVRFKCGSVEREIGKVRDVDMLVADPPRSGLPGNAISGIIRLRPKEMIVVSCEPPTFARDTKRLIEAGYILNSIHLVDLFPGTYHTETVALFKRS
jgi:23S rRNA (uracil1939-C5)-methyltransferase